MAETAERAWTTIEDEPLKIADREFRSRLILGTGKWRSNDEMLAALEASGCEMVTVALRRIDFDDPKSRSILEVIDWTKYQILPNTAGCRTAEEAIRVARLARAMGLSNWVKLEVIPDPKYLLPDPIGTLEAAKVLVKEGFVVLPYINQDPVLAKQLEEIGCATVMPLASPIGSGQGTAGLSVDPDHRRAGERSGDRGCGYRCTVGCCAGDGTGSRCLPHQYRDRPGRRPGEDGAGDATGDRGRPTLLPGWTHSEEAVRVGELSARRCSPVGGLV
jgi:hypothetical protein